MVCLHLLSPVILVAVRRKKLTSSFIIVSFFLFLVQYERKNEQSSFSIEPFFSYFSCIMNEKMSSLRLV